MRKIIIPAFLCIALPILAIDTPGQKATTPPVVAQDSIERVVRPSREHHRQALKIEQIRLASAYADRKKARELSRQAALRAPRARSRPVRAAATSRSHAAPGGIAACIAKYESGGNPRAENPSSSASGLYQFIDSTWRSVTGRSDRASDAPVSVQTAAFYELWDGGRGARHWVTAHKCL